MVSDYWGGGGWRRKYILTWYLITGAVGGEGELFTYVVSEYWQWGRGKTIYLRGI